MDTFKEYDINVKSIDKKEFVKWLSDAMKDQISYMNSSDPYVKLNGLILFEVFDYLRKKIEGCTIDIDPDTYRQIISMIREKRHFFEVKLDERGDFVIKGENLT